MPAAIRVFVAVPPADLRKGYDGLSLLARDGVKEDPLSGHLPEIPVQSFHDSLNATQRAFRITVEDVG